MTDIDQAGPGLPAAEPAHLETAFDPLIELEVLVERGELAVDEALDRSATLLAEIQGQMVRTKPQFSFYSKSIGERSNLGSFFDGAYLPANVPGSPERRYKYDWPGEEVAGLQMVKSHDIKTGLLAANSRFLPRPGPTAEFNAPAIGIEVRPLLPMCRLEFEPYINYSFGHEAEVPTAAGNANFAFSKGELRLVAQRVLPDESVVPLFHKTVELWRRHTVTGAGYDWDRGRGQFPGRDVGLRILTGKGERLRLWVQASVYLSKQDFDPSAFTSGQAYLDCEVPFMWVNEVPI